VPAPGEDPAIVVVGDSLGNLGGTERVLRAILGRYPDAELVAPFFGDGNRSPETAIEWPNRTRAAFFAAHKRHLRAPLYARRIAAIGLGSPSVVLTLAGSGWSLAAGVPHGARHVSYFAAPPPALDDEAQLYLADYPRPLRTLGRAATPFLRGHNRRLGRRPDRILTNSHWTAGRIRAWYGRDADVLYPPVMTDFFTPGRGEGEHVLVVARLVRNKQVDLVLDAVRGRSERLIVVGGGPDLARLRRLAPSNACFTGFVSDAELRELYRASTALVCPSREEFGIVMAEALACGVPVIAPATGGACEVVQSGRTGVLLPSVSPSSIARALDEIASLAPEPGRCRASVERFSDRMFVQGLERVLEEELAITGRGVPSPHVLAPAAR
jgi:glycosyltransferase involved in cell wall biosynthesis